MRYLVLTFYVVISQIISAWFDFVYDGKVDGGEITVVVYLIFMILAFWAWGLKYEVIEYKD